MLPTPAVVVSRRVFVRTTLNTVLTAGVAVGMGACAGAPRAVPHAWRTPGLLEALGPDRVRRIGEEWRARHPAERTAEALRDALSDAFRRHGSSPAPFARAIAEDFEADRLVIVDGWMLAVTEARQCALFGLSTT